MMGEVIEMEGWVRKRVDDVAHSHPSHSSISEDTIRAIWAEHLANNPPDREAWEVGAMREMGFVFPDDSTWEDPA